MISRTLVKHALSSEAEIPDMLVQGWVRTRRDSKAFSFLEINDGSSVASLQVVADAGIRGYERIAEMTTGAAVSIRGALVAGQGKQRWELRASSLELVGAAPESYPLQKKGHTPEFLRSIAHLRPRTNLFGAVFRMRSRLAASIHRFFQSRDFVWVSTPIITASDCEGAGEMFRVTTLDVGDAASRDAARDFFGKAAYLTVSGQLEGEAFACALSNIYTFGPTFRAENSNTTRHAAEFWMVEPEMAFYEIEDNMDLAEEFLKYCIGYALENCADDIQFLNDMFDKGLTERLKFVLHNDFVRLPYTTGVKILEESGQKFEFPVFWGADLASEHERYLVEQHFKKPVILTDYPKEIKAFYMKQNDDGKTVRAMDVLFPGIGEIIGGSQREENFEKLQQRVDELGLKGMDWYMDTRRYGTVPHSGFGLGFERLVLFVTGMQNIRDVIPFPRYPKNCEY